MSQFLISYKRPYIMTTPPLSNIPLSPTYLNSQLPTNPHKQVPSTL